MATAKKLGEIAWQAVSITSKEAPTARSGHSITCTRSKTIVFGGCGVTEDGNTVKIFNETWLLTTNGETYSWAKADAMGDEPTPRWRHTATLLPGDATVLVFGGLNKGMRHNDSYVLDVAKMEWNIKECAGSPPCPRSHHTANLVNFAANEETMEAEKWKVRRYTPPLAAGVQAPAPPWGTWPQPLSHGGPRKQAHPSWRPPR